jgi:dCMP deaminase
VRREAISDFLKNFSYKKSRASLDWDDYFMKLAHIIKERSSCIHRKVGAVVVKENRILCTGYNQPPSGFPHCDETECIRDALEITSGESQEICYAAHAEQNAIAQAAKFGISTRDSTIYITHKPCSICARILINAGIIRVVYGEEYPDPLTEFLFEKTGVRMELYKNTGG